MPHTKSQPAILPARGLQLNDARLSPHAPIVLSPKRPAPTPASQLEQGALPSQMDFLCKNSPSPRSPNKQP